MMVYRRCNKSVVTGQNELAAGGDVLVSLSLSFFLQLVFQCGSCTCAWQLQLWFTLVHYLVNRGFLRISRVTLGCTVTRHCPVFAPRQISMHPQESRLICLNGMAQYVRALVKVLFCVFIIM